MKNTICSLRHAVLAALWTLGPASYVLAATAEPTISDTPGSAKEQRKPIDQGGQTDQTKPTPESEDAQPVAEPELPPVREGPLPRNPFTRITPPGDPFGLTPYTGYTGPYAGYAGFAPGIPSGAGGFRLGPAIIFPNLRTSFIYDDNIFASNTNKKGSSGIIVSPGFRAEMRAPRGNVFGLSAGSDIVRYSESSASNYDITNLSADANLVFTSRARLSLVGDHVRSVDRQGTVDRPVGTEPDKWSATGARGVFAYGAPGARGRIEVEGGYRSLKYKNNQATTAQFDHDDAYFGGAFYWRIMPKTSLLFSIRQTNIDYGNDATQSSTERLYSIGATWEATAQTTGTFKVGYLTKDFDSSLNPSYTGLSWEGTARWSPRTYSFVDVTTAQYTSESTGFGDYALSRVIFANWTHSWTSRIQSNVRLGYRQDGYRGGGTDRKDNTATAGAGLSYQFRRWLRFEGRYDYVDRSSNIAIDEYNRNIFMFTVGLTL